MNSGIFRERMKQWSKKRGIGRPPYSEIDHAHCWDQDGEPACGMSTAQKVEFTRLSKAAPEDDLLEFVTKIIPDFDVRVKALFETLIREHEKR
jgi:hypothetical protein